MPAYGRIGQEDDPMCGRLCSSRRALPGNGPETRSARRGKLASPGQASKAGHSATKKQ